MNQKIKEDASDRPERFISHALVEIKKIKWLPFFVQSGILLDMSTAGFKVELTSSECKAQKGDRYWLRMPLSPLGFKGLSDLECQIEVKWFEPESARLGGIFLELDARSQHIVDQIVSRLKDRGNKI